MGARDGRVLLALSIYIFTRWKKRGRAGVAGSIAGAVHGDAVTSVGRGQLVLTLLFVAYDPHIACARQQAFLVAPEHEMGRDFAERLATGGET